MKNINATHALAFCSLLLVSTGSFAERGHSHHDKHSSHRDHSHSQKHYKHQRHSTVISPRKWNKPSFEQGVRSIHNHSKKQYSHYSGHHHERSKHSSSNRQHQYYYPKHYQKAKHHRSNHYSPRNYAYSNKYVRYINNHYAPRYPLRTAYRSSPGLNLYFKF